MNQTSGCSSTPSRTSTAFTMPPALVEHEAPEQRGDDGRNRPRQEHGRADQPAPAEGPVHRQREHGPGHQLEAHADDREQGRVAERAPEARVAEPPRRSCRRRRRAAPATASAGRAGAATPRRSRGAERARSGGSCRAPAGRGHQASRVSSSGRGMAGSRLPSPASSQQSLHLGLRRPRSARAGSSLTRQRPVQMNLQDLRELRCRPASPAAGRRAR